MAMASKGSWTRRMERAGRGRGEGYLRKPFSLSQAVATALASSPSTAILAFRVRSVVPSRTAKAGARRPGMAGVGVERGLAGDGAGFVDHLGVFGVFHQDQVEGGDGAVGAVGHGGVDAGSAFGRGAFGGGGVAAGQDDEVVGGEGEAVGGLEGGEGGRTLDELGGARRVWCRRCRPSARNRPWW